MPPADDAASVAAGEATAERQPGITALRWRWAACR